MPTLYERLGGVYSIATVIDDFIDRVMMFDASEDQDCEDSGRGGDGGRRPKVRQLPRTSSVPGGSP